MKHADGDVASQFRPNLTLLVVLRENSQKVQTYQEPGFL
jgi:hypothetical protein